MRAVAADFGYAPPASADEGFRDSLAALQEFTRV